VSCRLLPSTAIFNRRGGSSSSLVRRCHRARKRTGKLAVPPAGSFAIVPKQITSDFILPSLGIERDLDDGFPRTACE
jgi:hypothetical protein